MNTFLKSFANYVKSSIEQFLDKFVEFTKEIKTGLFVRGGEIEVTNFPQKTTVEGEVKAKVKFPSQFDVNVLNQKEPLKTLSLDKKSRIVNISNEDKKVIAEGITSIAKQLQKIEENQGDQKLPINDEPSRYMNVRLTNGKNFIESITRVLGGSLPSVVGLKNIGHDQINPATIERQNSIIAELQTINSLVPSVYDYISASYPEDDTEVYTFRNGGEEGETVSTITVVYTSETKENLLSVTRT